MSSIKKLNPTYEPLTQPETFKNHLKDLRKENSFPVEAFPDHVQRIINETNQSLNFPIDFIGASLLFATSVSIGNSYKAIFKEGWEEKAVLYMAIVGAPGTNKSHPFTFALKPIEEKDRQSHKDYERQKAEFDALQNLSKKELKEQELEEPIKPIWEQHLVTDFTPEALTDIHRFNNKGLGVYADELASWFNNFNRYNKGSEEQFWLTSWSCKPIRINRKTVDPVYIASPFISVAGTIQPGVLNDLAENRTRNGFLDRILFAIPDQIKKESWSDKDLKAEVPEVWSRILNTLLQSHVSIDESGAPAPSVLRFSKEAKQRVMDWQERNTDLINEEESEALQGIYSKLEVYAIRLSLCLELLHYSCKQGSNQTISLETVEKALKLVEYFRNTAIKAYKVISNEDPVSNLDRTKAALYEALPSIFDTAQGVEVADCYKIPERSFKRLLKNKELFVRVSHGKYEKLL
ncbi:DUF3987 domain-containing protein [Robertkochia marina]|uniref:DUF3987 domain-containing protein n=1 Tax=Robertkochia marina TaxID=1227945 RepID=A0A4S3LZT5_9FLAO|nr:DUF3987 domain-containing protein [Robertkochia marina]THD66825.1 DUF3987 domain-containing protein [Robertkochia marina]TRZ40892.1 DUF3987 domain-containing protein [Robertkochia marina]